MNASVVSFISICLLPSSIGGFMFAITQGRSYKLRIPFVENKLIELGFIGDILYGLSGGIVLFYFEKFRFDFTQILSLEKYLSAVPLYLSAGYCSTQLFPYISSKLLDKNQSVFTESQGNKDDSLLEAAIKYEDIDPNVSIQLYDTALKRDKNNTKALKGLLRLLNQLNTDKNT